VKQARCSKVNAPIMGDGQVHANVWITASEDLVKYFSRSEIVIVLFNEVPNCIH